MKIDRKSVAAFGLRLMALVSVCSGLALLGIYVAFMADATSPMLWPSR